MYVGTLLVQTITPYSGTVVYLTFYLSQLQRILYPQVMYCINYPLHIALNHSCLTENNNLCKLMLILHVVATFCPHYDLR